MMHRCMNTFLWSCKLILLSLILCFGISERALAQYFPIHATVQWPAPQSPYLADYSTAGRDRLIVTLLNRDQQQPLLFAKLRLQLKSGGFTAKNREEVAYPMLELNTGVPFRLTGIDLAPYLQPQNLQSSGNLRNGQLPTGYAELSVQVVEYYTGRPLSDWHTARAYLDVKKPPFLNLPEQDAQVALRDPLFIRFQWTPRHQGLSGTEYEFVLKELPDNGVAPQSAFAYGQEIYRTHTRSTSLSYTHLDPLLLPNRRYAWQVRALAREGVNEVGMFEHGGYSEISWFTLNDRCDAPRGLKAQPRFAKVDLSWSKVLGTTGYVVECRPKTKLNVYEWAQTEVAGEQLTLARLKPGWTYEWRVGTRCTGDRPVFSEVREFTLSKYDENLLAACGKEPVRSDLVREPHLDIRAGDVVTIGGDYPMTITEVTPLGDGWYAGKGKTRLKTIIDAPIALRFDRLRINVDKYQIDGTVEAAYDEGKGKIANMDYVDDGGKDLRPATLRIREQKLGYSLPESPRFLLKTPKFFQEGGNFLVETQDADGHPQTIQLELQEGADYKSVFPMTVTDAEGNSYRIQPEESGSQDDETSTSQGQIALKAERVTPVGDFNADVLSKKYGQVRFERGPGKYAFDDGKEKWYQKSVKLDRFYKPFAKDYIAPWKLIPEGETDVVTAHYEGKQRIDVSKLVFTSDAKSPALPSSYDETSRTWSIKLPSVASGATYDVFAVYEGEVLGKLHVVSYAKQRHKVTLVPINDAKLDKTHIERELNAVYTPVGVHFDVEVDERMRGDYSWEVPGEEDKQLSLVGKSFWGYDKELKESTEMLQLQQAYQAKAGTLEGAYLFVLDGAKGLSSGTAFLQGEMPRKSRFGYLFSNDGEALSKTIAHELGHGLFTLRHTFDSEYAGKKSQDTSSNLMDYAEGTSLAAFQWNVMASPAIFTAADKVEEGKKVEYTKELGRNVTRGLAPDGRVIVSWQSKSEDYYIIPTISKDSNAIRGFRLYKVNETEPIKKFYWNDKTYATTAGETIENCPEIKLLYYSGSGSIKTTIYELVGDECTYRCADVLYDTKGNKIQDGEKHWVTKRLWDANSSCYAHFIQDIKSKTEQECSSEDVAKELAQLNKAITSNSKLEDIKDLVLSTCLSSLRGLSYASIEHLLQKVTSQEKLDNQSELVVLRLMNAINGRDYPHFYSLLEANNNKLLKFLVREMDDASILFWTNDNYTNFIGALVWMFNSDNCKSIINRLPNNAEDYAQRVVNLKPITYEVPKAAFGKISLSTKHNDGKYDSETGEIELRDVYTTYLLNTAHHFGPNIAKLAKEDSITSLSPLTPIIIVPEDDKLPLIQTALSGGGLSNQMYIVPAIFLKYRFDKIRNDKIEKAVVTTLDVATIVLSGGTALATKVHWIRRAWALAEVVGAVGNVAVNTQVITNQQVKDAIGIYNTAMGLIGLMNAGQAGYKFVKNLPQQSRPLLQENNALKDFLVSKYQEWKQLARTSNLSASEKKLLRQQEEVWSFLRITEELPGLSKLQLRLESQDIKSFLQTLKIKKQTPDVESFMSTFKSLHREVEKAAAGSIKSLDEVAEDLEYLLTQHLATFRTQGREEQMSAFINEMMQTKDKFKAGATTLEVIRHPQEYISAKYSSNLSNLELEDLISHAAGSGNFRFDAKWRVMDPQKPGYIQIFVDTKNYSRASSMFRDLGQFKAYLREIDSFDQLYIIQQGGREVTREQIINRLRNELLKPENLIEVFKIIRSKPSLNRELLEGIKNDNEALERLTLLIKDPKSVIYTSVQTTK